MPIRASIRISTGRQIHRLRVDYTIFITGRWRMGGYSGSLTVKEDSVELRIDASTMARALLHRGAPRRGRMGEALCLAAELLGIRVTLLGPLGVKLLEAVPGSGCGKSL